jgi:hypothetical protein
MTTEELVKLKEGKQQNKFKSRTFWLTAVWLSFVPLSIAAQVLLLDTVDLRIDQIVAFAGSITLVYIGGNKGENIATSLKVDSKDLK